MKIIKGVDTIQLSTTDVMDILRAHIQREMGRSVIGIEIRLVDNATVALGDPVEPCAVEPSPAKDDWIKWGGRDCPVSGHTFVEYRFWGDEDVYQEFAKNIYWGRNIARRLRVTSYRVVKPAAPEKDDGWIEWGGGACPIERMALVDVKLQKGSLWTGRLACDLGWSYDRPEGLRIIAYRIAT